MVAHLNYTDTLSSSIEKIFTFFVQYGHGSLASREGERGESSGEKHLLLNFLFYKRRAKNTPDLNIALAGFLLML